MICGVSETAFSQMIAYIDQRANHAKGAADADPFSQGLEVARVEAEENGVSLPSPTVGTLLTTLAAAGARADAAQGAVAVTPAAGTVGLHLLRGLPEKSTLTCIEPEAALQSGTKAAVRAAGYAPSRVRFLTARPLDVMGRLANDAYQVIYADVSPVELGAIIDAAWPLLTPGGTLVLAGSLLDGTVADATRRDRETAAAREADDYAETFAAEHGGVVTRLPLDGGLTLVTKR
nr:class I SAM-dependent methyltransferase [Corynebacterium hadale]